MFAVVLADPIPENVDLGAHGLEQTEYVALERVSGRYVEMQRRSPDHIVLLGL